MTEEERCFVKWGFLSSKFRYRVSKTNSHFLFSSGTSSFKEVYVSLHWKFGFTFEFCDFQRYFLFTLSQPSRPSKWPLSPINGLSYVYLSRLYSEDPFYCLEFVNRSLSKEIVSGLNLSSMAPCLILDPAKTYVNSSTDR